MLNLFWSHHTCRAHLYLHWISPTFFIHLPLSFPTISYFSLPLSYFASNLRAFLPAASGRGSGLSYSAGHGDGVKKRDRSAPPSGPQASSMKRTKPLSSSSTSPVGSSAHSSPRVHESPLHAVSGVVDAGVDLFWSREGDLSDQLFPESALAPFIVLMESTIPGRNLGKYDFIAIADLIDEVIDGERVIRRNGQNQCKIICEAREDANTLILSVDLKFVGYKLFIPSSLLRKKAFIRDVEPEYAPKEIVDRLDLKSRHGIGLTKTAPLLTR